MSLKGKAKEHISENINFPSPLQYNLPSGFNKNTTIFGKQKLSYQLDNQSMTPGPGTYQSKSFIMEKAKHSFGKSKRNNATIINELPGPGNYKIQTYVGKEGTSPSLCGRARSLSHSNKNYPGPGSYNPLSHYKTVNIK